MKKRLLYSEISKYLDHKNALVITGMRQVGKSTIMRQVIRTLLQQGVDPKRILYVSFDDPLLRANFDSRKLFHQTVSAYVDAVLQRDLRDGDGIVCRPRTDSRNCRHSRLYGRGPIPGQT